MVKLTKAEAKQLYEQEVTICVIPCNISQDSDRFYSFIDQIEKDCNFEKAVSYYRKMNCNERDGLRLDFYRGQ